jgi:hypothetical protein
MTLFYETENDFCDRHPKLCTSEVPGISLIEEPPDDEYHEEAYSRYECSDEVIGCELRYCGL